MAGTYEVIDNSDPQKIAENPEKIEEIFTVFEHQKDLYHPKNKSSENSPEQNLKNSFKKLTDVIKSGNNEQISILRNISKKLEENKVDSKTESTNDSKPHSNTIEKLITGSNRLLSDILSKLDKLNGQINKIVPVTVKGIEEGTKSVDGNDKKSNQGTSIKTLLSTHNGENTRYTSRIKKFVSSIVSRGQLEKIKEKEEVRIWRKRVLELLSKNLDKDGIKTFEEEAKTSGGLAGKLLAGGLLAALAGGISYALAPEKVKKFIENAIAVGKDAVKVVGSVGSTLFNAPDTFRRMGIEGEENKLPDGTTYKPKTSTGQFLQGVGNATIRVGRDFAVGATEIGLKTKEAYDFSKEKITEIIKFSKSIENSILKFSKEAANLPEKVAGALANGALNISTAIYNAVTGFKDTIENKVKSGIETTKKAFNTPDPTEVHTIKDLINPKNDKPDNIIEKKIKSGVEIVKKAFSKSDPTEVHTIKDLINIKAPPVVPSKTPTVIPNVVNQIIKPSTLELNGVKSMADDLMQKEKDRMYQQQPQSVIIDNTQNNNQGNSGQFDGPRLGSRNYDSTKERMDVLDLYGGNLGIGSIIN